MNGTAWMLSTEHAGISTGFTMDPHALIICVKTKSLKNEKRLSRIISHVCDDRDYHLPCGYDCVAVVMMFCPLRHKAHTLAEVKQPERSRFRQMTTKSVLLVSRKVRKGMGQNIIYNGSGVYIRFFNDLKMKIYDNR